MRIRFLAIFGLPAMLLAQTGMAISSSSTSSNGNVVTGSIGLPGRAFMGTPVTGAPYSAQRVSEHVQVAADGTRFTQTNRQETIYRDSQGRVRTERPMGYMGPNASPEGPMLIQIQDPIAGYSYTLDTQSKTVHRAAMQTPEVRRMAMPAGGGGQGSGSASTAIAVLRAEPAGVANPVQGRVATGGAPANIGGSAGQAGASARPRPEMKQEDLGQQVIEGVVATGHRMTQTWPAGSQGNDRPFEVVSENWFSPDLKEVVLTKNTDPRSGENTTKLINISRNEPSADLFIPPADYQVVDETGPFQIHWTAQRQ